MHIKGHLYLILLFQKELLANILLIHMYLMITLDFNGKVKNVVGRADLFAILETSVQNWFAWI